MCPALEYIKLLNYEDRVIVIVVLIEIFYFVCILFPL